MCTPCGACCGPCQPAPCCVPVPVCPCCPPPPCPCAPLCVPTCPVPCVYVPSVAPCCPCGPCCPPSGGGCPCWFALPTGPPEILSQNFKMKTKFADKKVSKIQFYKFFWIIVLIFFLLSGQFFQNFKVFRTLGLWGFTSRATRDYWLLHVLICLIFVCSIVYLGFILCSM